MGFYPENIINILFSFQLRHTSIYGKSKYSIEVDITCIITIHEYHDSL